MILRYLNIEVALGVVALALIAQRSTGVVLPWSWYVVVPPAVWALYVLDRLNDDRRARLPLQTGRHLFARKHRRILTIASFLVLATAAVIAVVQFPAVYWLVAVGLGLLTLSHVLWQRAKSPLTSIIKDVNVAVVYTVGAWSIPIAMVGSLDLNSAVVLCASILLVFVDVIWLSIVDHGHDAEARAPSIAIAMGVGRAATLARLLSFVAMAILLVWMMSGGDVPIGITLLCMALIYAVAPIIRLRDPDIARLGLELVLVLPLWLLLL